MRTFERPTIVMSRCIEHDHCRFDGSMISSPSVRQLMPHINVITVCPEMAIGLPSPREALRIVRSGGEDRLVFSHSGEDKTDAMNEFSSQFLRDLDHTEIDGFILKHRSPSCGMNDVKIYKGTGKSNIIPGKTSGLFGRQVTELFQNVPVENEGRLRNFNIREGFLISIFTLKAFKEVKQTGRVKDLIAFHSENKYLLMAYSPGHLKTLGKITANHERLSHDETLKKYEEILVKVLMQPLNRSRNINALLHIFGYFKKDISATEKAYFLENLELYNQKKVPFSVMLALLKAWVVRFDQDYLKTQTIFEPFPVDLFDVTDSGKGL